MVTSRVVLVRVEEPMELEREIKEPMVLELEIRVRPIRLRSRGLKIPQMEEELLEELSALVEPLQESWEPLQESTMR